MGSEQSDKEKFTSQFVTSQFSHLSNMIQKLRDENDPFGDRRAKLSRALGHLALSFAELVTLPPEREPSFKTAADRAKYGLDEPVAPGAASAVATQAPPETPKKRGRKPKAAAEPVGETAGNGSAEGTSIDTLGLGTRAYNCLKKKKVLTVEKLVTFDEATLLKIPRFGKTCLEDVQKRLKKAGRALGHKNGSAETAKPEAVEEPELATAGAKGGKPLPW